MASTYGLYTLEYGIPCLIGTYHGKICWFSFDHDVNKFKASLGGPNAIQYYNVELLNYVLSGKVTWNDLYLIGPPSHIRILNVLFMTIPRGVVVSYKQLAELSGYPNSARLVGTAMSSNRIAYLIPCHRVIKSNGTLGDYQYSLEMKKYLLQIEGCPV